MKQKREARVRGGAAVHGGSGPGAGGASGTGAVSDARGGAGVFGGQSPSPESLYRLGSGFLAEGRRIRMAAAGYSMYPSIRPGDTIDISPLPSRFTLGAMASATHLDSSAPDSDTPVSLPPLQAGDVLALRRENDFVVHRLTELFERDGLCFVRTRGDSVLWPDDELPLEAVAGRVTRIVGPDGRQRRVERSSRICYLLNRLRVYLLLRLGRLRVRTRRP